MTTTVTVALSGLRTHSMLSYTLISVVVVVVIVVVVVVVLVVLV